MAQDNPVLQYPAKEVCRSMARPSVTDFVRFLKGVGPVKFNSWFTSTATGQGASGHEDQRLEE